MALLALLASPALAGKATSERWKMLWDKQAAQTATWEGASYEQRLIATHNTFWANVYAKCARTAKSAGMDEFSAVAVIDAEGKITEFVIFPDNPALKCFSDDMVGRRYPAPPVAPFHEGFTVTLGKVLRPHPTSPASGGSWVGVNGVNLNIAATKHPPVGLRKLSPTYRAIKTKKLVGWAPAHHT